MISRDNFCNRMKLKIEYLVSPEKLQAYAYMAANILTMLLAFIINLLLTRWASPEEYGQYKYATNFILLIPSFFEFGLHFSCSRIVAEDRANEKHPVAAVSILIMAIIGIIVSIGLYLIIYICGYLKIESMNAIANIRIVFPFVAFFMVKTCVTQLFQGTGKIFRLSMFTFVQYIILILGICVGKLIYSELTFKFCIWMYLISNIIVVIPTLTQLDYRIKDYKNSLNRLLADVRKSGIMVYISSIVTTSASSIIGLICGSVYGYTQYGYYSLALSLAQIFTFVSSAMAVVKFRDNVHEIFIKKSDTVFMIAMNVMIYIDFLLMIYTVFFWFFTSDYEPAVEYLIVLAFAYILNGMTIYYNRFFIARGLGVIVMKCSIYVALANIVSSAILIPKLEIMGLVIASLITSAFNFGQYILSYSKYAKKQKQA